MTSAFDVTNTSGQDQRKSDAVKVLSAMQNTLDRWDDGEMATKQQYQKQINNLAAGYRASHRVDPDAALDLLDTINRVSGGFNSTNINHARDFIIQRKKADISDLLAQSRDRAEATGQGEGAGYTRSNVLGSVIRNNLVGNSKIGASGMSEIGSVLGESNPETSEEALALLDDIKLGIETSSELDEEQRDYLKQQVELSRQQVQLFDDIETETIGERLAGSDEDSALAANRRRLENIDRNKSIAAGLAGASTGEGLGESAAEGLFNLAANRREKRRAAREGRDDGRSGGRSRGGTGKMLKMVAKVGFKLLKFLGPIGAIVTAAVGVFDGFMKSKERFDLKEDQDATISQTYSSVVGSIAEGISFGYLDAKDIANRQQKGAGDQSNFIRGLVGARNSQVEELEAANVVDTSVLGNSEVRDWDAMSKLTTAQLQKVLNYDDWSDETSEKLQVLLEAKLNNVKQADAILARHMRKQGATASEIEMSTGVSKAASLTETSYQTKAVNGFKVALEKSSEAANAASNLVNSVVGDTSSTTVVTDSSTTIINPAGGFFDSGVARFNNGG